MGIIFSLFITKFVPELQIIIILIFTLGIFFESSLLTFVKQFEGLERMNISSFLIMLERVLLSVSLLLMVSENLYLKYSLSYLISNSITTLIAFYFSGLTKKEILTKPSFKEIKYVISNSFIFFFLVFYQSFIIEPILFFYKKSVAVNN